jgi:hypothetical protein
MRRYEVGAHYSSETGGPQTQHREYEDACVAEQSLGLCAV